MNKDAEAFFDAHPDEPFWYYSQTLRVPNPTLKPWLEHHPWPEDGKRAG